MINLLHESGFCCGVKAAVHKTDALAENLARGEKIFLFGDLVNNRHVMARLKHAGFVVAQTADEIYSGCVIIRAHGVGRDAYEIFAKKNIRIVDCTCEKVKKIHKIVSERVNSRVIIVGKKNHPEVLGILGWCDDGVVVENENEIAPALCEKKPLCVVAQTTCNKDFWEKSVAIIKGKFPDAEIFYTLCDITAKRIEKAVEMAKNSHSMVVVGDKKSANSVELFEACKSACTNVFFVSSLEELAAENISFAGEIGIAGSASSPSETIEEIREFLLFSHFLAVAKSEIEDECEHFFAQKIEKSSDNLFIKNALHDLHNLNKNGKRIRGAMVKLGIEIASENEKNYSQIAMAYEIFQTAILIHDDIIDKSSLRRGKKTIHARENNTHFGISRAICVGDYGLFLANNIISKFPKTAEFFSEVQLKTIEGEIMDVILPHSPIANHDEYSLCVNKIYELKTAWYTLAGPLMLGAICGGASEELIENLREIALPLGMAYQIKDDLLGIFASEKILGKPALSDIIEKKQTILYGFAKLHATSEQQKLLESHYGNPRADNTSLEIIRNIFTKTGAKKFAEDEIIRLSQSSLGTIEKLQKHRDLLRGLVHFLTLRRY
ncbi:MAG: 4-hydroxy-3-methylbut-2-enyl diphosphate reductase [Defluviitaleaceae bacterium]|nr:4-hydroxy-3-methylbut-2-enyl diphosphate reductase [Defluviitaleaceae bacterium]